MVFFIEVVNGPLAGSRYQIKEGITIGRNRGDIIIEDSKISGAHATFAVDNKDQFILNDLGSANGILSGNRRVRKLAMMPGVVFRLGSISFKVVEVDEPGAEAFAKIKTWKENLVEKLSLDEVRNHPARDPVQSFSPTLELHFLEGVQAGDKIKLGYGPRTAGSHSLDLDLLDPGLPEKAFQLIPGKALSQLRNLTDQLLTVNDLPLAKNEVKDLNEGDRIKIKTTLIKIGYT